MRRIYFFLALCGMVATSYSCRTHFPTTPETYTSINISKASVERGKNLAYNVCGQCHYDAETKAFTGTRMEELPHFMGNIYSANLTDYPGGVMSKYNDAELIYLLKTGIARDGRFVPYMIRPTMADDDMKDIIAYLRSGDPAVKSNPNSAGTSHLSGLGKMATHMSGKPLPYNTGIKRPDEDNPVAYGRYLVDIVGCYHCHSKSIISLNYVHPEQSKGYMAGGMKFKMHGAKIRASNLTPDKETGIGNYTKDGFRKAVRDGIAMNGRTLSYPMRRFTHLTDKQVDAIYAYLQQLPPDHHHIKHHNG